jgi:exosortase/archaeosortase family protein
MPETLTVKLSLKGSTDQGLASRTVAREGASEVSRSILIVLFLTFVAIATDQYAAPILQTTSPLWATAACLLLVWRQHSSPVYFGNGAFDEQVLSKWRVAAFFTAHVLLILFARWMTGTFQSAAGTPTSTGALIAVWKFTVLAPTLLLLPPSRLKEMLSAYKHEIIAGLVVMATFSPWRVLQAVWPWYGQVLGRFVYELSRFSVPGLGYVNDLTPTLTGPHLDITIVQACSGITGFELFGYLFSLVTLMDWNRLRKGRALFAYFAGLLAVLVGNALRITSFVVFGNHGFADFVLRFHVSAGWIFFSVIFLIHLLYTYGWMLEKANVTSRSWNTA